MINSHLSFIVIDEQLHNVLDTYSLKIIVDIFHFTSIVSRRVRFPKKQYIFLIKQFLILFAVCAPNHHGPSCARWREWCQSCDSITGRCTQCPPSFYGGECQYICSQHYLDLICDQGTVIVINARTDTQDNDVNLNFQQQF